MSAKVYVGTYSVRGSEGIYIFRVDPHNGALERVGVASLRNPSFVALSPDKQYLYAVNEVMDAGGQSRGAVTGFRIDSNDAALSPFAQQQIPGEGPCHAAVHPSGRWLVTSNYSDGTHTLLPLGENGSIDRTAAHVRNAGEPGPRKQQGGAHAHCAAFDGDGKLTFVCDLGLDRVIVYALDSERGALREMEWGGAAIAPGSGPRHLVLHPNLPLIYVVNELSSTISVLHRSGTGGLSMLQTISILPKGFTGESWAAAIHLDSEKGFLYASNRGHDSLAAFSVDNESGLLNLIGHTSTGGSWPRSFAALPGGLILVANERSDNIVAFKIGADGIPVATGEMTAVPSPTCIAPY